MNAICPTTLQGSQFANGGPRIKRLIVLYLMTALPPYLDRRKDFILEYLQKYYNASGFGRNAESKWWLWMVCAWKAAKIGNFLAFLQVKIMSIRSIANRTSRTSKRCLTRDCHFVSGRQVSDYCASSLRSRPHGRARAERHIGGDVDKVLR